jgi:hypothetical protein
VFSEDRSLRYELRRSCGLGSGTVMWIMFNPSTADEEANDPTIRRVIDFSQRWGFGELVVVNLLPIRSPNPKEAWAWYRSITDVGQPRLGSGYFENWNHIEKVALEMDPAADAVVAAWGSLAGDLGWSFRDHSLIEDMACLGVNADGQPKHPLYVARSKELEPLP